MTQMTEDSLALNASKELLPAQAVVNHHSVGAAVDCSSFQALTLKKRTKPLYPSDLKDLYPAFSSSWPYQQREACSANSNHLTTIHITDTENGTEAKTIDSDSSSDDAANQWIRVSQGNSCSTSDNRGILFLRPAAVIEQSLRQGRGTEEVRVTTILDKSTDDDEESQRRSQQMQVRQSSKSYPWEDEACGASGTIGPEITTSKTRPNLKRIGSDSDLAGIRRQTTSTEDAADDEYNNDSSWEDGIIHDAPEMTEAAIRQQSMMSVPGAIAVAGIHAGSSLDADFDNVSTVSIQEALRRICTMDTRGLDEHDSDHLEMTAAIRQQSIMSVPGAVAVDGINGRFGSDADSDDETTASMREALRYTSSRGSDEILVQGVLAAEETDVGAYVSVMVIRQAPVIDAEGIHVIRVDDDELEEPESMAFKSSQWGGGLVCSVVVAALVCVVIFLTMGNRQGKVDQVLTDTEGPTMAPTLAPTNSELPKVIEVLKSITEEATLLDHASPQFMAAEWLSRDIVDKEIRHEKLLQRYVLAIMQFAYGIKFLCDERSCNYHHSPTPFLTEADECTWNGITCNGDGLVTRVLLFDRSASLSLNDIVDWKPLTPSQELGMISSEIKVLTELSVLVIEGFDIAGSIEHIFHPSLKNLRTIRLSGNALTGTLPGGIWKTHPNLEILDVSNNRLSGPIPDSIGRISSLKTLNLQNNKVGGPIPSLIGSLTSLEKLNLARTLVEGSLPSEMVGCSESLLSLDLSYTEMSGPLPAELELFESLQRLNLEGCAFDGPIPQLPCSNTQLIRLNNNNFSGTISSSLGRCTSLEHLNLRNNPHLKGSVPDALCGDVWDYVQQFTSFSVDCDIVCDCCDFNPRCDDDW